MVPIHKSNMKATLYIIQSCSLRTVPVSAGEAHHWHQLQSHDGSAKIVSSWSERVLKVRPTPEWNIKEDETSDEGGIEDCPATDVFASATHTHTKKENTGDKPIITNSKLSGLSPQ